MWGPRAFVLHPLPLPEVAVGGSASRPSAVPSDRACPGRARMYLAGRYRRYVPTATACTCEISNALDSSQMPEPEPEADVEGVCVCERECIRHEPATWPIRGRLSWMGLCERQTSPSI